MTMPPAGEGRDAARPVVPRILGPGQGRPIAGREEVVLKATGAETGGALAFMEATTPPGEGPAPHVHHGSDELFYVLEGLMRFRVGEREVEAGAGAFVFVPRGTVHAARNAGAGPVRLLAAFVPAGPERDMEAFAQAPREERDRLARASGSEFVAPPSAPPSEG
jgi:mannose-6-phosphate isomerase-like protein (cupin superfamily)